MDSLYDAQPGALGFLRGDGAACRLLLEDRETALAPADAEGNLAGIIGDAWPAVVQDGYTGPARRFAGAEVLVAADPRAATYLPHSVSAQAIVRWDRDAQATAGEPGTVISRGLGTDPAQLRCFHVHLRAGADVGQGVIELAWQSPGADLVVYPGAAFEHAAGWHLFTAVREHLSPERVLLRYYRNAKLLAAHDIDSGQPGRVAGGVAAGPCVLIGAAGDGAGAHRWHLCGDIDSLAVRPYAMTGEEIETQYLRLSYWQPQISRALHDLLPPGRTPSRDPDSIAQRILKATAQPLALAESRADDAQRNALPPRCYGPRLQQWEDCLALPGARGISIDDRRARVQAALRRELGFTADGVRQGLAPLLGVEPGDIELITVGNLIADDFSGPLDDRLWQIRGPVSAGAGELVIAADAGEDIRNHAAGIRAPLADDSASTVHVCLRALDAPGDVAAGLCLQTSGWDAAWLAVRPLADGHEVVYRVLRAGNLSPWMSLGVATLPVWLRWQVWSAGNAQSLILASWSADGPYTGYSDAVNLPFAGPVVWAGCTMAYDGAALPAPAEARFADMAIWTPEADRPFHLYAYRDPALPGRHDLAGARLQLQHQRAARDTIGVGTVRALPCDDPDHGCDGPPLGGFERPPFTTPPPPPPPTPAELFESITGLAASWLWIGHQADAVQGAELRVGGDIIIGQPAAGLRPGNGITEHTFALAEADGRSLRAPSPKVGDIGDLGAAVAIAMVIRTTNGPPPAARNILGKRQQSPYNGFEIVVQPNGVPFVHCDAGAPDAMSIAAANIADDAWHTLVFAYRPIARTFQLITDLAAGPVTMTPGDCTSSVYLTLGDARLPGAGVEVALLAICTGPQVESAAITGLAAALQTAIVEEP